MTPAEFEQWCRALRLAPATCDLIASIRAAPPARRTYIENLMFLEDYVGFMPTVPQAVQARLLERVRETPGIPLAAVIGDESGIRANDVYAMLAQDLLYTDLYAAHLMQHWRIHLYLDAAQAQAYAQLLAIHLTERTGAPFPDPAALTTNTALLWDGRAWILLNLGETTTTLLPETGLPMQFPSTFFLQLLETGTVVNFPPHPPRSTRVVQTISRWIKQGGAWELSEHKR